MKFLKQDLFKTDISEATVVTLYLLPSLNLRLLPKLNKELKPGTRIVSHAFDMGSAKPIETLNVNGRTVTTGRFPSRFPRNRTRFTSRRQVARMPRSEPPHRGSGPGTFVELIERVQRA